MEKFWEGEMWCGRLDYWKADGNEFRFKIKIAFLKHVTRNNDF
jgi:hypothetical protein